jgi:hypothetical protein
MYPEFGPDILAMNARYKLADIDVNNPRAMEERLIQLDDILSKECAELTDIQVVAERADLVDHENFPEVAREVRVQLADLLADIVVYCTSEAARWNIPLPDVLKIVMMSNTSKLGADGEPIINPENGKFEKGPNYWKPEAAIEHRMYAVTEGGSIMQHEKDGLPVLELLSKEQTKIREAAMNKALTGYYDLDVSLGEEHPN